MCVCEFGLFNSGRIRGGVNQEEKTSPQIYDERRRLCVCVSMDVHQIKFMMNEEDFH